MEIWIDGIKGDYEWGLVRLAILKENWNYQDDFEDLRKRWFFPLGPNETWERYWSRVGSNVLAYLKSKADEGDKTANFYRRQFELDHGDMTKKGLQQSSVWLVLLYELSSFFRQYGMNPTVVIHSVNPCDFLLLIDPSLPWKTPDESPKELQLAMAELFGIRPSAVAFSDVPLSVEGLPDYIRAMIFGFESRAWLLIDPTIPKSETIQSVKNLLSRMNINEAVGDPPRRRKEVWEQLKVWSMRKERLSYKEIAEKTNVPIDTVKKRFHRAFEITQGHPYNRRDFNHYLEKPKVGLCDRCDKRSECTELCPDAVRYTMQDYKYKSKKERLIDPSWLGNLCP